MIDKKTAGILYAHSYRIVDKEGKAYNISELLSDGLININRVETLNNEVIGYEEIGTDYHILARPHDLTKEVNGVVPLVECAKISMPWIEDWHLIDGNCSVWDKSLFFYLYKDGTYFVCEGVKMGVQIIPNQLALFDYLYQMNFAVNLPDESWKAI